MQEYQEYPRPEDFPEEVFVVCLHDGETASENAETIASWVVKNSRELRTVTSALDALINEHSYFIEAMWTVVRSKKEPIITRQMVVDTAIQAQQNS